MRKYCKSVFLSVFLLACVCCSALVANELDSLPQRIQLPAPEKSGGNLLDALAQRKSMRNFADVELPLNDLSTLLWAAAGINRDDGKLTYPTRRNYQDMLLYVVMKSGTYKYDPKTNNLELMSSGDQRKVTGKAPWVAKASVNLIFVQDTNKWPQDQRERASSIGMMHAGYMMQNAALYSALKDWCCVVRTGLDAEKMKEILKLEDGQNAVGAQTIGIQETK